MSKGPGFDDNGDLFRALYKMTCRRARETGLPIEVILCQVIYQAAYELVLGDEITRQMIDDIVEAAALQVAINSQAEDVQGGVQ